MQLSEIEAQSINGLITDARKNTTPASLEVSWVIDLGTRFKGTSTFVDDVTGAVPRFYDVVLDGLKLPAIREKPKENDVAQKEERKTLVPLAAPRTQPDMCNNRRRNSRLVENFRSGRCRRMVRWRPLQ